MDIFKWWLDGWEQIGNTLVNALPKSPIVFLQSNDTINHYLSYVNWFIPIYTFVSMTEAWLTAIVVYYVVSVALRWAKVVE